ncbi:hypothetical protein B296_00004832 [Ensete ventricosum]|uniref:Uncharacterized protein n=1 Tax=Ensete ventricosum TaxID=4639 RepID=A0A427AJ45_ENSVE|nr:hypothetical protein B296_00004832 [Ensete ventricosum]
MAYSSRVPASASSFPVLRSHDPNFAFALDHLSYSIKCIYEVSSHCTLQDTDYTHGHYKHRKLLLNAPSLLPLGTTAAQQQQLADSETNIGASSSFFRRLASPAFLLFQSSNLCRGLRFLAGKPASKAFLPCAAAPSPVPQPSSSRSNCSTASIALLTSSQPSS